MTEHTQHVCTRFGCIICNGGLKCCTVCSGAECCMPTDCPGHLFPYEVQMAVCHGEVDYTEVKGWHKVI